MGNIGSHDTHSADLGRESPLILNNILCKWWWGLNQSGKIS